jgi:hypothetical protein
MQSALADGGTWMMPLDSPTQKEPEHWRILCEQAAHEQNLDKLVQLVREINRLLIKRLLRRREAPTKL